MATKELIGRQINKSFGDLGTFEGTIKAYKKPYFQIVYTDGDKEELSREEILPLLIPETESAGQDEIEDVLVIPKKKRIDTRKDESKRHKRVTDTRKDESDDERPGYTITNESSNSRKNTKSVRQPSNSVLWDCIKLAIDSSGSSEGISIQTVYNYILDRWPRAQLTVDVLNERIMEAIDNGDLVQYKNHTHTLFSLPSSTSDRERNSSNLSQPVKTKRGRPPKKSRLDDPLADPGKKRNKRKLGDSNIFQGSSSEVEVSHVLSSSPLLPSAQVPSLQLSYTTSPPSQLNHELDTDVSLRLSSSIIETESGTEVGKETAIAVPNQHTDVRPDNLDSSPTNAIAVPDQHTDVRPDNFDSSPTIGTETSIAVPNHTQT